MADQTPRVSRWRTWLLVASLALNLAIIGAVIGLVAKDGRPGPRTSFDISAGPLARALDKEDRDAIREALREAGLFQRIDRGAIREDMQVLQDVLRAEPFDAAAFQDALTRQRSRLQTAQDAVLDALTDQIAGMSAAERAGLADRLDEQMRRGPERGDRDDNGGHDRNDSRR